MEIWKDINGYEGLYQISSYGQVKSLERVVPRKKGRWDTEMPFKMKEHIMKQIVVRGYCYVTLCKDDHHIRHAIHRLVAQAFLDNPENLPQVNHKDEDKGNNHVDNLEWCDARYNINYGNRKEKHRNALIINGSVRRGKNGRARKVICDGVIYDCITDCAEKYGVNHATLSGYLCGCDPMPPRWSKMGLSYYIEEAC